VELQNLEWLDPSPHPLDWNGPHERAFVEFRAEDLSRSIIENLERVVARHAERVAVSDSQSSLSFAELWERIRGLGRIVAGETAPGELIAILLPACSHSPLAMFAALAAGRPFTAVEVSQPEDWIIQTLESKAIRLVSELEGALGIELPVTLINEAPSFGKLCAALKQRRTTRYVPLVLLKEGSGAPPVYIVHGLGGNVAELFPLARRMSYPGAVFGIQARGLRAEERPHRTVEAMAVEYVKEIKARQPQGPYCLCGYSFGGLVAFEMARLASGMISAPIHTWPRETWSVGARMLTQLRDHLAQRQPGGLAVPELLRSAPASVLKVGLSGLVASTRYRPRFYDGELTLFAPASRDPSLPSPHVVWRRHALALSVVPLVGTHLSMFSGANAEAAAASLSATLTLSASLRSATKTSMFPASAPRWWVALVRRAVPGYFRTRTAESREAPTPRALAR